MLKRFALAGLAIALLLLVGLAGVWLWGQVASPAVAQDTDSDYSPAQTITVVGQGTARMEPDIARVSVGVETSGESIGEAVAENDAKMASVLAALAEAGVEEKDIQTANYSISLDRYPEPMPRVESATGEPQAQYRVSNMANVIVRDLESVGDVLDAVVEAGANNIWGISFSLEDPTAAQAEARADALDNAAARAEALAELSGVALGPVMSISEVIGTTPVPAGLSVERAMAAGGAISPGELEIGYQVQVVYFIER
ncbi:MAG: SIMPL domain-containing protein [Anaerolineae bacterium]|jgi:hypothetical protein